MQLVSKMIKSVWTRPINNVYLIGCQHLNLNLIEVREEINRISNLQGAVARRQLSELRKGIPVRRLYGGDGVHEGE